MNVFTAISEPSGDPGPASSIRTSAVHHRDTYVLSGRKADAVQGRFGCYAGHG
jgi:hypothetical protein